MNNLISMAVILSGMFGTFLIQGLQSWLANERVEALVNGDKTSTQASQWPKFFPTQDVGENRGFSIPYRSGNIILQATLDTLSGPLPDSVTVQAIERELNLTDREMPLMWRSALGNPIGVKALQKDIQSSVLWLARVLYTESNRPKEWRKVAWVVRNRVDYRFQGEGEYRTVILDKGQFSHFNSRQGRYEMEGVYYNSRKPNFDKALRIAYEVITAPYEDAPFSHMTLHYYSSVSMSPRYGTYCHKTSHSRQQIREYGRAHPKWAHQGELTSTGPDPERFRFFQGVP